MHSKESHTDDSLLSPYPLGTFLLLPACAGALGWGIRGQYGHETGAMIAGMLVGLTLILILVPRRLDSIYAVRAVALMAVGIGFGGSMTYGQTVGLTHDGPLIGHHGALAWGLLGLGVKGGVWIGFAGALFGMGLGGKRYSVIELLLLFGGMILLLLLGVALLNRPFDPEQRILPKIYFSDHWKWEPGGELKPRNERWGGLWCALVGLGAYLAFVKRDRVARNLALWGIAAGALGFPLGQCVQAANAWHPEWFQGDGVREVFRYFNWWNMMETTFGGVFGAVLGLGVWLNRQRIRFPEAQPVRGSPGRSSVEWSLVVVHIALVVLWNFGADLIDERSEYRPALRTFAQVADLAVTMGILPVIAIFAGRWAPYLFALPAVIVPIAGKTYRQLVVREEWVEPAFGFFFYLVLPLALTIAVALWGAVRREERGWAFAQKGLIAGTWTVLLLNWEFFHRPWPWQEWTGRTPNGLIFFYCAVALSVAALWNREQGEPTKPG